ncbi:Type IV pilus biogenesis and competence protein PilQ precursor [Grimontia celer]|uniref:Type IV pilus biogenesis and competence protein PilQ n=1 Tax=Grimontia celer TaxID=1796497 RepID=A0A128FCT5_9GAMM|nr:type IV pilus secretin PilQ [Grimontia celer]CZF84558.1 Type IV pilus biogenesis and competence protein PilQ precursor [Grimontia celer]
MISLGKGCRSLRLGALCRSLMVIAAVVATPWSIAANQLQNIEVKAGENGKTLLALSLEDKSVVTNFTKSDGALSISLKGTSVEDNLVGVRSLQDIGKATANLDVKPVDDDVELTVLTDGHFGYDYYQTSNVLTVEIFPFASLPSAKKFDAEKSKKNKNISINFQDIPVRSVLQMVAEHNGFNLVVSDSVQGSLTLRLDDVPWQKALQTILNVKGLDKRQMGNILLVAPKVELDEQERLVLEKRRQERELASLRSEVIQIKYANAVDLKEMIGGGSSGEDDDEGISLLSERGSIAVDPRTNSLVIKDLADNIDVVKMMIDSLDIPVDQVEIEARIVTVDEGTLEEIGVRWGINSQNGNFTTGGSIEGNWQHSDRIDFGADNEPDELILDDLLNVNLGAVSPNASSIAFSVANLGKDLLLDLELSALQAESRAEIISSPRLLTTNKRAAYIEQGTELPYLEASSSGAAAVSFKKAVLSLSVTPQITPDSRLVLDLQVTQDKPAGTVKAGTGEAMAINTQRIGTQVLVNDGETVVLGGIYQHEMMEGVDKVPLLGDIPGLGQLFRRNYETMGKRELLIFVTPRIMAQ